MPYEVEINRSAERELKALPPEIAQRIGRRLRSPADDPHPAQSKRLQNSADFRLRVGDYRAIYSVDDVAQIVTILAIGHRHEIYR